MQASEWKKDYEEFEKVTRQFYAGEIPGPQYKGFSGGLWKLRTKRRRGKYASSSYARRKSNKG